MDRYTDDWAQQALIPADALELTMKLGLIASADHAQVWIELKDPTTGVLLGARSAPHMSTARLPDLVEKLLQDGLTLLEEQIGPFDH